jgi:hypothetical protein
VVASIVEGNGQSGAHAAGGAAGNEDCKPLRR